MHRSSQLEEPLLKQTLHDFLQAHALIGRDREAHFVVAYSGGRDSTALLHALTELKAESTLPVRITAAYYWHPWRPLQEDIQLVSQNCQRTGVPWIMLTPNLTLPKTETAARQDRYQQLANLAHDLDATAVLTAHHQDDQVETILFRILRGTGIEGMVGIPEARMLQAYGQHAVCVARPFLQESRSAIDAYIEQLKLPFVEDPTNTEIRLKRNFLRHEILPRIETAFPQARQSIMRLAELTEGDLTIIDAKMNEVWQDVYEAETQSLNEVRFNQLSHPFQRRIVRRYLETHHEEAGYHRVEDVIAFISGKNRELRKPSLFSLGPKRFIAIYRNRITVEAPQKPSIAPLTVPVPTEVCHRDLKATLTISPLTYEQRMRPIDFKALPEEEIYVDLSRFEGQSLVLRTRQEGDRIKPLGMASPIKLKRFFINRGISRFERDGIPLLTTDSQVLWVVGIGISEEIRVKTTPTHRITIKREG